MDLLAQAGYLSIGQSMPWDSRLVLLHVGSDLLIAFAYLSIPFALAHLARRRPDLDFRGMLLMFACFILACGITYLLDARDLWISDYWMSGVMKAVTAAVSIATAVLLWKALPTALAWPSPAQLRSANAELEREVERRRAAHRALRQRELQFRGAFDHAPIGKALVTLEGSWLKVNAALCAIVGYSEAELLATNFHSITHPEDLQQDVELLQELLEGRRSRYETQLRYVHHDGSLVWVALSVTLVMDGVDRPYLLVQIQDISQRLEAEAQLLQAQADLERKVVERTRELARANRELERTNRTLEELARTDALTQLCNRRHLMERLHEAIAAARRYGIRFSLLIIDIDRFKTINDMHGHLSGDQVIAEVAQVLRTNTRQVDVAARLGGDEFCVVASNTGAEDAERIAEKLREAIGASRLRDANGAEMPVSCSIGIVEWQADFDSDRLLDLADQALYAAKRAGRNRVARV